MTTKKTTPRNPHQTKAAQKRLINDLDSMAPNSVADEFLALAFNVENALLDSGAAPGTDYSRLDLFKLASPLMAELFRTREKMDYQYPAADLVPQPGH